MRRAPNLMTVGSVIQSVGEVAVKVKGSWHPCRPMGLDDIPNRLRLAWGVFTGRYDALKWPAGQ